MKSLACVLDRSLELHQRSVVPGRCKELPGICLVPETTDTARRPAPVAMKFDLSGGNIGRRREPLCNSSGRCREGRDTPPRTVCWRRVKSNCARKEGRLGSQRSHVFSGGGESFNPIARSVQENSNHILLDAGERHMSAAGNPRC